MSDLQEKMLWVALGLVLVGAVVGSLDPVSGLIAVGAALLAIGFVIWDIFTEKRRGR